MDKADSSLNDKVIAKFREIIEDEEKIDAQLAREQGLDPALADIAAEQMTDAIGVAYCICLIDKDQVRDAAESDLEPDENMKGAKAKFDAHEKVLLGALALFESSGFDPPPGPRSIAKGTPIAAEEGKVTMQRILGSLVVEEFRKAKGRMPIIVDTGKKKKVNTPYGERDVPFYEYPDPPARINRELQTYNAARAEETARLVPDILEDVEVYGKLYEVHKKGTDQSVFEKLKEIEGAFREQGLKYVDPTTIVKLTTDPAAPDSRSLAFVPHARKIACEASVVLYREVSTLVSAVGTGDTLPGGLKKQPRLVFKTMVNYGGNFSRCRDISRCTVVVDSIEAVLRIVEALMESKSLKVIRVKNRLDSEYDSAPIGGYRDVQLMCLVETDSGVMRFGEVQVNLRDFVQMKAGINPETGEKWVGGSGEGVSRGHEIFKLARKIMAYDPSSLFWKGGSSKELWARVGAGVVLEVDLGGQKGEGSAKNHVKDMKAALVSKNCRLRELNLGDNDLDDKAGKAIGIALQVNTSIKEIK